MGRVRFGLIGYGAWGSHHARAIGENADAQLCAIGAKSEGTAERAKSERPGAHVYRDWREMLAKEELDVVAVVLPTDLHHEVGMGVLESGRHLLLEKPMALSVGQCDELIATAERKKKLLAIGHEFRLSSLWGKVKEMIDAGAIGEPRYALIELWRRPYRLGAEGWRYDINRVGNWILEEPIHFFDLARWYFQGAGEPVGVYARGSERRVDRPELQDNFSATVRFDNGGYAVISQTLAGWEHHQAVKITGREGAIWASWSGALDRTFEPTFWLKHQRGEKLEEVPVTKVTGEVYELVDQVGQVVRAVKEGTPLPTAGRDGRWSVAMCLKAQESVETGKEVGF